MSFQLIWWRHPSLIANWLLSPSKLMVSGLSSSLNFVNRVWTVSDLYADSSINCSKNYPERVWKNNWRSCAASMHFTFSINIKATSSLPVVWPLSKLPSPMSFFDLSTPRSVPPLFEHIHYKNKTAICHLNCFLTVRFVLMPFLLWMPSTTPTTTWVLSLVVTMEMCIQSFTRKHGRILWTSRWCRMGITSTSGHSSSNSSVTPGSKEGLHYRFTRMVI